MLNAVESIGRLKESASVGVCQFNNLIQELTKEGVAIFVLSFWHGDSLIVIEFFISDLFGDHE